MNEETSNALYELFYTPSSPASFSSPANLFREVRKRHPDVQLSHVKKWLKSQYTYTLHRRAINKFSRNQIVTDRENRQWQIDLVDLRTIARRNKGFCYLLNCVDVFSRKAIVTPLKSKNATDVRMAFQKIFQTNHPDFIQSDQG